MTRRNSAAVGRTAKDRGKAPPRRTCIACGKETGKRELVRIVRTPEGRLEVDSSGKKSGRGAYLCADPACWLSGLTNKRLERAFRIAPLEEDRLALQAYGVALAQERAPEGET